MWVSCNLPKLKRKRKFVHSSKSILLQLCKSGCRRSVKGVVCQIVKIKRMEFELCCHLFDLCFVGVVYLLGSVCLNGKLVYLIGLFLYLASLYSMQLLHFHICDSDFIFFSVFSQMRLLKSSLHFLFIYLAPSLALKFSSFMKHLVFQPALNLNVRLKRTLHILSLGSLLNCSIDFQNLQFILSTIIMMLMGPFHYGLLHFSLLTRLKMAFFKKISFQFLLGVG